MNRILKTENGRLRTFKRSMKKLAVKALLIMALLLVPTPSSVTAVSQDGAARPAPVGQEWVGAQYFLETTYADALESYRSAGLKLVTDVEIAIPGGQFTDAEAPGLRVVPSFEGRQGQILLWESEEGWVEWEFDAPQSGLYEISLEYYTLEGKRSAVWRELRINGERPFVEAKQFLFPRTWNDLREPRQDNRGWDVRPPQQEILGWQEKRLEDANGMFLDPIRFHFAAGTNRIRLIAHREPVAIAALRVLSPRQLPTYNERLAEWRSMGKQEVPDVLVQVQAEHTFAKSQPTIRREVHYDTTVEPPAGTGFKLNTFGGYRWRQAGQTASWQFNAPEDGLYHISLRALQAFADGRPSVRALRINGEIPFAEMREIHIGYDRHWQTVTLAAPDGSPYLFYLPRGENLIALQAIVGSFGPTVRAVEEILLELSEISRRIVMITGARPDPFVIYEVDQKIPNLLGWLTDISDRLEAQKQYLTRLAGQRPNNVAMLEIVQDQLQDLVREPDTIPFRLEDLGRTQGQLGDWVVRLKEQWLQLDWLAISTPATPAPDRPYSIGGALVSSTSQFLASFRQDYNAVGSVYTASGDEVLLTVWVGRGLEWALILRDMIDDDFTPRTGIKLNVRVMPAEQMNVGGLNAVLLAMTAGEAPDVAMALNPNLPIEFAIRNGVIDLTQFPDFEEVAQRFRPGALIPYQYQEGVYALPETQDFSMLFYRTDILNELELPVPETWEELYNAIIKLQQFGLNFYYEAPTPTAVGGLTDAGLMPILFQAGGEWYTDDGFRSALNTPEGLAAFKTWTDLFISYKLPLQADFFTRFRMGQMPMGVSNYWTYVRFKTAAPELRGRWAMSPMPGTPRADGRIDRTNGGRGQAIAMFRDTRHPQESWEFIKWWTAEDTQMRYGTEVEALLGVEARWNTANVAALQRLPWDAPDIEAILEQWYWFKETPVVLGGYFTPRHIYNAWNKTVLQGEHPRDALEEAVREINKEMRKKQEEFGLLEQ